MKNIVLSNGAVLNLVKSVKYLTDRETDIVYENGFVLDDDFIVLTRFRYITREIQTDTDISPKTQRGYAYDGKVKINKQHIISIDMFD